LAATFRNSSLGRKVGIPLLAIAYVESGRLGETLCMS
jgi:hypothetical protein